MSAMVGISLREVRVVHNREGIFGAFLQSRARCGTPPVLKPRSARSAGTKDSATSALGVSLSEAGSTKFEINPHGHQQWK